MDKMIYKKFWSLDQGWIDHQKKINQVFITYKIEFEPMLIYILYIHQGCADTRIGRYRYAFFRTDTIRYRYFKN